ncbi:MAG TPA: matrixin family metalloprotease [Terriglobia bacterium]|nr:matrixin family metalloprotease [Terriglobia bacterium]
MIVHMALLDKNRIWKHKATPATRRTSSNRPWAVAALFIAGLSMASVLAADHESAKQSYVEANGLFDLGRFAEAVSGYNQAIADDPKYVEAYYNRALASEMVDRAHALENWQRFLDAADDLPTYKWDVARIQARIQILKAKPTLPEAMQPGHYVPVAGDYYREIGIPSEGEQWRELPVKVFLGSAPNIKWQQGAREAFDIWSAVFPMQLVVLPKLADIRMGWEASAMQEGRVGEENEWVRFQRVGGEITGRRVATITVDLSRNWSKDEMRAIVLHELGHALGIKGHSDSKKDIMFWQMQDKTRQIRAPYFPIPIFWKSLVSQPSQRDINTLIRLYNSPGSIARFD